MYNCPRSKFYGVTFRCKFVVRFELLDKTYGVSFLELVEIKDINYELFQVRKIKKLSGFKTLDFNKSADRFIRNGMSNYCLQKLAKVFVFDSMIKSIVINLYGYFIKNNNFNQVIALCPCRRL